MPTERERDLERLVAFCIIHGRDCAAQASGSLMDTRVEPVDDFIDIRLSCRVCGASLQATIERTGIEVVRQVTTGGQPGPRAYQNAVSVLDVDEQSPKARRG